MCFPASRRTLSTTSLSFIELKISPSRTSTFDPSSKPLSQTQELYDIQNDDHIIMQFVTSNLEFRFSLPFGFGLKTLTCRLRKIVTRHRRMRTCSSRVTFTFEVRHPTSPCDSRAPFELRLHRHTSVLTPSSGSN